MAGGPLAEGPLKELVSTQDDGSSVSFQLRDISRPAGCWDFSGVETGVFNV